MYVDSIKNKKEGGMRNLVLIALICLTGCKSYKVILDGKPNLLAADPTIYKSDKYYCLYNTLKDNKVCIALAFSSKLDSGWTYDKILLEPDPGCTGVETPDYVKVGDLERIYYVQWHPEYIIHLAEKINGEWIKRGEVLRGSEKWETLKGKSYVGDMSVLYNGRWHMWYQSAGELSNTAEITHVESEDGVHWGEKHRFTKFGPYGPIYHVDVTYKDGYTWVGWCPKRPGLYRAFSATPLDDYSKWETILLEKDSFKGQECHSTGLFSATELEGRVIFHAVTSTVKDPCVDQSNNSAKIYIK